MKTNCVSMKLVSSIYIGLESSWKILTLAQSCLITTHLDACSCFFFSRFHGSKRIGVTTLIFHRLRDHSIPHRPTFPVCFFGQFFWGKTHRLATIHTLQTTDMSDTVWRHHIWINSFPYQACQVVAVCGRRSRCSCMPRSTLCRSFPVAASISWNTLPDDVQSVHRSSLPSGDS